MIIQSLVNPEKKMLGKHLETWNHQKTIHLYGAINGKNIGNVKKNDKNDITFWISLCE